MKQIYKTSSPYLIQIKSSKQNGILILFGEKTFRTCKEDKLSKAQIVECKTHITEDDDGNLVFGKYCSAKWNQIKIRSNQIKADIIEGQVWINGKMLPTMFYAAFILGLAYHKNNIAITYGVDDRYILEIWKI